MKKSQQGMSLVISLIFLVILTLIGFSIANKGKLSSQIAKTSSRYDAVAAAAEDEMYRLTRLVQDSNNGYIKTGNGTTCDTDKNCKASKNPKMFTQVWDRKLLAEVFGKDIQDDEGNTIHTSKELPVFTNYQHEGWGQGIQNTIASEYGAINTRGFVQELVQREVDADINTRELAIQYMITIKASASDPGDDNGTERESMVIQSVFGKRVRL